MNYKIGITEYEWHELKRGLLPLWWLRLTARFSKKNRELLYLINKVNGAATVVKIYNQE